VRIKLVISLLLFSVVFLIGTGKTHAATTAIKGITVAPAVQQITLQPNQTTADFSVSVTNNTTSSVILAVGAQDFTSLGLNGSLSFYKSNPINTNNKHGLTNYLSIGLPQVALAPKQSQVVPISVINADQMAPGGHYTAITFKITGTSSGKGSKVLINQTVSSLVFLTTAGQGTQTTILHTPLIGAFYPSLPNNISAVFSNNGNTQTTLRGYAQILNSSKEVVSQGQINIDSNLILPSSSRLFTLQLTKVKNHVWPGFYTLKVFYLHDGQTKYSIYTQKFFFLSWWFIIVILIIVMLIIGIIAFFKMTEPATPVKK